MIQNQGFLIILKAHNVSRKILGFELLSQIRSNGLLKLLYFVSKLTNWLFEWYMKVIGERL